MEKQNVDAAGVDAEVDAAGVDAEVDVEAAADFDAAVFGAVEAADIILDFFIISNISSFNSK